MADEVVVRMQSEPTGEEWRAIRTFLRRAKELSESSLVANGYDLSANVSLNAGEPPKFTVCAIPPEEPFRSMLLTFRHFVGNDEPSNFLRVLNLLAKRVPDAREYLDSLRTVWHQALFGGLMNLSFNGKDLTANYIFDLWLNARYFHNDEQKEQELDRLIRAFTEDFVKFLLANAVTECCKAILRLSASIGRLGNSSAAT
jgi:hypothetical protein